jgi:hypothetical protein
MPRRKTAIQRRVKSLKELGPGELARWRGGRPIVGQGPIRSVRTWASWGELFECYAIVRAEYLERFNRRSPGIVPGIEALFEGFQRDGDIGAERASEALRRAEAADDPRYVLKGR